MSFPGIRRLAAMAVLAGTALCAYAAEGPVASVQQSLKAQQFYFGEVNGKFDEETRAALKRFQIHDGLPVSGELDTATLQALQSRRGAPDTATAPAASAASNEPAPERSVRGRARNLVQSDREFLAQVEGSEDANTPPAPPSSSAPEQRSTQPVEKSVPPPPVSERPQRPRTERSETREPVEEEEPQGITKAEARRLVNEYLAAAEQPTPEGEVSFFADKVDYFDSGKVSRSFIEKDQRNYYRRWPSRNFELLGDPELVRSSRDAATVRFRLRYAVRGSGDSAKGQIEEVVRLQRTDDGLKIVAIRERKLGE
ncbi:peptidoglycan-binding protein [Verrucomicrobiota bacterium sgz303538]